MISIVVTTKNEGKNLPLLLDSLRDQCSGHEIVIVDSYSKDNTADVVQHYSEFLPIVFSRERSSRGGGRNLGVQLSRGDYVLFLDGDVTASPDLIESYERASVLKLSKRSEMGPRLRSIIGLTSAKGAGGTSS